MLISKLFKMAGLLKRQSVQSVDDVMESRECLWGKKFSTHNKPNIKKHCDSCNTFITFKRRRKANAKSISGYFSVKIPLASEPSSNYGMEKIISNETSKIPMPLVHLILAVVPMISRVHLVWRVLIP